MAKHKKRDPNTMDCAEIRQKFVEYYQHLGFQLLPRAPMMHPSVSISCKLNQSIDFCLTNEYSMIE